MIYGYYGAILERFYGNQNFAHMVRTFSHGSPAKTRRSVRRNVMNILSHV